MSKKTKKEIIDPKKQVEDESLIVEIEESIKQENIEKLWTEHGKFIISLAVLIILITAIGSARTSYINSTSEEKTALFINSMDTDDPAKSVKAISTELSGNLKALSLLSSAGILIEENNTEAAVDLLKQVPNEKNIDKTLLDLSHLTRIRLIWGNQTNEELETSLEALKTIWSNTENPWRYHASIEAALIYAYKLNNFKKARSLLKDVSSAKDIPQTLSDRANALHHIFSVHEQLSLQNSNKSKDAEQQG